LELDALVALACDVFECPIALVSLVGRDRQWFKARCGIETEGTSRDIAFCAYAIEGDGTMVVENAARDPRFQDNPLVTGNPEIRFYAGQPLSIDGEHKLGTFCIIDTKPRKFSSADRVKLKAIATAAEGLLRAFKSRNAADIASSAAQANQRKLEDQAMLMEQIASVSGVGGWELQLQTGELDWTAQTKRIHGVPQDYVPEIQSAIEFYSPKSRPIIADAIENAMATGRGWDLELDMQTATGNPISVRSVGEAVFDNGEPVRLIGAFQDITDQKSTLNQIVSSERSAKAQNEKLCIILANMIQGVSVFDANACLDRWNDQYVTLFEKPDTDVYKGVSLYELIEAEKKRGDFSGDVAAHIGQLRAELDKGAPVTKQFRLRSGRIISSIHAPMPGGGWVGTHIDVTESVRYAERVRHLSLHDPLTGLANRLLFNQELGEALGRAQSDNFNVALLMIDLDDFKQVNDALGHDAGDELLQSVAKRLRSSVRVEDLIARLGGDEFAIVCQGAGVTWELMANIAERVVGRLGTPFNIKGIDVQIGASIGIANGGPDPTSVKTLCKQADSALYKVKHQGKNQYRFFDQEIAQELEDHEQDAVRLRQAIESGRITLCRQPVFDLRDSRICGYEVQAEWDHTDMPVLSAAHIVKVAEKNGMIDELGTLTLDAGIRQAASNQTGQTVAINLSPLQLGRDKLVIAITSALERYGLNASRLELETTERVLLQDHEAALGELKRLKELGVRIVLDQFGSGSLSFDSLKRFPIDKIKLAPKMLRDLEECDHGLAVLQAVSGLAREIGIELAAEGIENNSQLQRLKAVGCTVGQGSLLGETMPADSLAQDSAGGLLTGGM